MNAVYQSSGAPGTNPAAVELRVANAPHQLPTLEAEIRRLTALIRASALQPQDKENAA